MKKICYITTIPITLKLFVLKSAIYIHENSDYDITFICNYDENFKKSLPPYIHYIPIKMNRGVSFEFIKIIIKLYKIFKNNQYDLVQYSTPNAALYASVASRLAKIKNRLYCQWGIRYVGFNGLKRRIFKLIEKSVCNNSTWIEPDSYGNLYFSYNEKLYTNKKSSVIWNGSACGVDLQKFDISMKKIWRNEIRNKISINKSNIVIGFVGRIDRDKGINELFTAFRDLTNKHTNITLMIVGSNDKTESINSELYNWTQNNEKVIYCGQVEKVEKYLSAMDIFVLPSYREGFGSVVVEAEAMGVPVIVTNIPGPIDAMVKNKTGLIVKKGDTKTLKSAISKLIKNSKIRRDFGRDGYKFAKENFDDIIFFEKMLEDRKRFIN